MGGEGVQCLSLSASHALIPAASPQPEARSSFLNGLDRGKLLRRNFKKWLDDGMLP